MPAARTLLLTRPERQSAAFAEALELRLPGRFRPIVAPVLAIEPVAAEIDLAGVTALLFTSANGVEQFVARVAARDLPAYCVGAMTAEAARAAGFAARSADGDVAGLAALVVADRPNGVLLHVRGRHAAGDLAGRLSATGLRTRAAEIYDQVPRRIAGPAASLLEAGRIDVAAAFSPRSARLFAGQARAAGWDLAGTATLALSAAADAPLAGLRRARAIIAARPTREAMLAALHDL